MGWGVAGRRRTIYLLLESRLSSTERTRVEQKSEIVLAVNSMCHRGSVWRPSHLSIVTKIHLHMTLIVPTVLYPSETWAVSVLDLVHLQAFHMRCPECPGAVLVGAGASMSQDALKCSTHWKYRTIGWTRQTDVAFSLHQCDVFNQPGTTICEYLNCVSRLTLYWLFWSYNKSV